MHEKNEDDKQAIRAVGTARFFVRNASKRFGKSAEIKSRTQIPRKI